MYLAKTVIFNEKIELENQEFYCFNLENEDLFFVKDFEYGEFLSAFEEMDDFYSSEENEENY